MTRNLLMTVLLGFFTLSFTATAQLADMPTEETCKCKVIEAFRLNNDTVKKGKAYVYKNGIIFAFGGATKVLERIDNYWFADDKDKMWRAGKSEDRLSLIFHSKSNKNIYYFKIPDTILWE